MNAKRVWGIVILIVGIILILVSSYISKQVEEGKIKIAQGQESVDAGKKLFSYSPLTKPIGKGITGSAQRQINQGKQDVVYYQNLANWLRIIGIILVIIGVIMLIFCRSRKKS